MSRPHIAPLTLIAFLLAGLAALPILSVSSNLFTGETSQIWSHLLSTVLPEYLANSLWLCIGVGCGVGLVGVTTAWLTAMHDFPGRRIFEWALVLPLAMPAYVLAYLYTDLLQFTGPVQTHLRDTFAWSYGEYWFPDIRTLPGAVLMFVCVLYPYVYLLARTAFLERTSGMLEAARTLGMGPWRAFFTVSLPLARPAVVAGIALALMETLADYGTVAYFAVNTFTTGIYRAWFSLGDRIAAAQLAVALLSGVLLLLWLEQRSRGQARYNNTSSRHRPMQGARLRGLPAVLATIACLLPITLGFLLPAALLLNLSLGNGDAQFGERFITLSRNSFVLAGITALLAMMLAVVIAYSARLNRSWLTQAITRVVGLGYAVPGAVIAVGVLIPVTRLDHWLDTLWAELFGTHPGLILTGGLLALIYAYLVRFLAVALHTVESSLSKITHNMDDAASSLGLNRNQTLHRVHLPMLRGSLLTATLLVFVDVMKELPATLVMRPFNFDTLATQTVTLASDERLAEASTAALAIVVVGLLPLILLSRQISASRRQ